MTLIVNPPRNVPHTVMPKLKTKFDLMVKEGVVIKVKEAASWVNNIVNKMVTFG